MKNEFKLLQDAMDRAVENKEVAGCSLLIIRDGKEKYYVRSGYADIENSRLMERDAICHLYSMTKPVTAAAAMLLVQDGVIDLNEKVADYFPSFENQHYVKDGELRELPEENAVRIYNLLNMTSGLVYPGTGSEAELETGRLFAEMEEGIRSGEMISTMSFAGRIGRCPLQFMPGEIFQYGTSADVLGAVIEKASGMSFGSFLKERIFTPLGMEDTGFYVPEGKKSRMAAIYAGSKNGLARSRTNHLAIRNDGGKNSFESGGAGLFSTIDDYARFAQMLMNGGSYNGVQILKESAVRYLTSAKLTPSQREGLSGWSGLEGYSYGNLMRVLEEPEKASVIGNKGEYGWDGWLGTYFANDPKTGTTVLMMTQKTDYGTGKLTRKLRNIIAV